MRLVALVGVVAATLLWPAVPARSDGPRSGQRIRVERPRHQAERRPRMCFTQAPGDQTVCVGSPAPRPGEELALFGVEGRVAVAAIVRDAKPADIDRCQSDNLWDTAYRVTREGVNPDTRSFGFTGLGFDPFDATLQIQPPVSPHQLRPGEEVFIGVDAGSNGTVDHLVTHRPCGDSLPRGARPGPDARCLAHWRPYEAGWRIIVEDVIYNCQ
ncbi:MAG TPA: hypothetical protein VML75_04590 [Kofleriaceae bacterium]|nr:hypothetical protein [Kofleriaceae bacterium]